MSHQSEWPSSKNLLTINVGEGVEKREHPCTVDGNVNWYRYYGKQYGDSSEIKLRATTDPEIPLLGIHSDRTITQRDTCTPMFTAALFTVVRTWKQPECPSTDEQIKKLRYIYTMAYYSAIKRNEFESFEMRYDKLRACYTEWSKSKRKRNIVC